MPSIVKEIWCHSTNRQALIAEVLAAGLYRWLKKTANGYDLGGDRTKIIERNGEMIAGLAVKDPGVLAGLQNIRAIGYFEGEEFIEMIPGGRDVFNRIYPRDPVTLYFPEGPPRVVVPPVRPGSLALELPPGVVSGGLKLPGL